MTAADDGAAAEGVDESLSFFDLETSEELGLGRLIRTEVGMNVGFTITGAVLAVSPSSLGWVAAEGEAGGETGAVVRDVSSDGVGDKGDAVDSAPVAGIKVGGGGGGSGRNDKSTIDDDGKDNKDGVGGGGGGGGGGGESD